MTMDLTDTLDIALDQLRTGEPVQLILADYPAQTEALMPLLDAATALEAIRPVEMPNSEALLVDRHEFLAEIDRLQRQAVSPGPLVRLKEWIAHQFPWPSIGPTLQRKEQRRMSVLLVKATLIISMVFGSAGGAAALAANSLPDSPLYPAKLAMEQTRLNATSDPSEQAALYMALVQVRAQEMERMALADKMPDGATALRLQSHLNQAFQLAARMPDDDMLSFLAQAQQTIHNQEQRLNQIQTRVAEPVQEPLRQATRLLNRARQEVDAGLQDPQTFRWRHTENRPPEAPSQPTVVPVPGGNPDCPTGDCQPVGDQHQYGPQPDQPGPGAPGGNPDCPTGDCEPVGDRHRYNPQPDQPGPGGPGGNPDCPTGDCEPVGDQHRYGPQPDQPGPGAPGGNPDCPEGDCQPVGDQNQYGPQPDQPGPGEPGGNPDPCTDCEPEGDQHQNGPQPDQPSEGPDDHGGGDGGGGDNDGGNDGGGNDGDGNDGDQGGGDGGKKH